MTHITRDDAERMPPATLADNLRTLAAIPCSFSQPSITAMLQAAAERIDPPPAESDWPPNPSNVVYDDMTRAWRNGDYALAWALADVLLQYMTGWFSAGKSLTKPRDVYYARQIYVNYAPLPDLPPVTSDQSEHHDWEPEEAD